MTAPATTGAARQATGGGAGVMASRACTLGDVRLVDGRVSYSDARSGAAYAIDNINMTVSLPSLDSPMKADGSLVWNKEKIALHARHRQPERVPRRQSTGCRHR